MNNDEMFNALHEKLCKIETLLTGNGTPERGLIVRVDRLEQTQQRSYKLFWFFASLLLAPEILVAGFYILRNL